MSRKSLSVFLIAALTTTMLLSGCNSSTKKSSESSQPAQKVTISFWDQMATSTTTPWYTQLISKFNSSQSEVQVDYVGIPTASALQKYSTAIAANAGPDVGGLQPEYVSSFVTRKALVPLDSYFDKWSQKGKIVASNISDVRSLTPDKKLYMLSNTSNFSCMWYRTDEFSAAGLQFPTTWTDFFADASKLTNKASNKYGYTIRGGSGSALALEMLMYDYSGITDFFDKNGKCTLDDAKNLEFATKYLRMYKNTTPESDLTAGMNEITENFDTGTSAMFYHNLGSYANHSKALKSDQFAAAALPVSLKGYRVIAGAQTTGFGMFTDSKYRDADWKFISYLCSADSVSYWNQNKFQIPTNTDVMNLDWVKNSQAINMASKTITDKNTKTLILPYYLPDYSTNLTKIAEPEIQAVLGGKETVSTMLKDWANSMTQAKADYDKNNKSSSSSSSSKS